MIPIIILCGGLATRLHPVTKYIPKSLIEISGIPFISYQLDLLKRNGVTDVILCVGKFGKQIEEYVGNGSKWGLNVRYSYDGDTLLGTGGAIKKALPMLMDVFMIMYGDSYLNIDFKLIAEGFEKEGKQGLMTVYRNENKWDKNNILFRNGQIVKYDKKDTCGVIKKAINMIEEDIDCLSPNSVSGLSHKSEKKIEMKHIDYGLSILRKDVFDKWEGVFDLSGVFVDLIERGEMVGVEMFERFYEIGSVEGIMEFEKYVHGKY